jgi:hypothetical protein
MVIYFGEESISGMTQCQIREMPVQTMSETPLFQGVFIFPAGFFIPFVEYILFQFSDLFLFISAFGQAVIAG